MTLPALPVTRPGVKWSQPTIEGDVRIPAVPGWWWLVVPDQPALNMRLAVLGPSSSVPSGVQGPTSHTFDRPWPQTVHEIVGSETPVITKARTPKSASFEVDVVLIGDVAWGKFQAVWKLGSTCLIQSDLTDQWYVDLGGDMKMSEVQSVDPAWTTEYVVTLTCREVQAI